ncbi:MAG TPA: bL35 family ribosomal protein [Candidatus Saccharimonadales bacterium]|nr:bL35 family ribosomal protein [Candidatus Saccharimonadales bacterium]
MSRVKAYKKKTHKGSAKRLRVTTNNKMLREQAGHVHFNEKKGEGRKRAIAGKKAITGSIARNLKRALGVK